MKKRFAILLAAVMLLSACSGTAPEGISSLWLQPFTDMTELKYGVCSYQRFGNLDLMKLLENSFMTIPR